MNKLSNKGFFFSKLLKQLLNSSTTHDLFINNLHPTLNKGGKPSGDEDSRGIKC